MDQLQNDDARERLLTHGRAVLARDGFTRARIKDIAEAAGVGIGTYYKHFPTKEALFQELAGTLLTEMISPTQGRVALRDEDPMNGIERANRRYLDSYRRSTDLMGIIEELSAVNPEVRRVQQTRSDAFRGRAADHIRALQEAGLASPDVDPRFAGNALTAMVSKYTHAWLVHPSRTTGQPDFEESVFTLTLLWGNAIGLDTSAWVARWNSTPTP